MNTKVYVGNLPCDATDDELRDHFGSIGDVVAVNVIIDRETGRWRGFGFVEMASPELAAQAIEELDGKPFQGRTRKIAEARPQQRERTDRPRRRDDWQ